MSSSFDALKARSEKVLMSTYGRYPLAVSRAEGARLYDLDGREYVDLLAGLAVVNLGHCRPELAEVAAAQARKLVHCSNLFFQEEMVDFAETLVSLCGLGEGAKAFLCNSGAEANEGAIKLARRYQRTVANRDAHEIVSLTGSFHGRTLASLTATGQPALQEYFGPLPEGFVHVPPHDLAAMDAAIGEQTAAVLMEMVQGEGGVNPMDVGYVRAVRNLCAQRGVLFMVDEIQTGCCRTGSFWSFERYGIVPDVFTAAKGLANGLPCGAILAREQVAAGFVPGSHATTFGGGGVVAAVGAKALELLQTEHLAARAERLGQAALAAFGELKVEFPELITDVRGAGLMLGIELADHGSGLGQQVWDALLDRGFVLNLAKGKVLRLLPPLTIAEEDLAAFTRALKDVLSEM